MPRVTGNLKKIILVHYWRRWGHFSAGLMQIVLNGVRKDFSQAVISYFSPSHFPNCSSTTSAGWLEHCHSAGIVVINAWRVIINAWKVIINAGMVLLSAVSGVEIPFRLNMDLLSDCFINFQEHQMLKDLHCFLRRTRFKSSRTIMHPCLNSTRVDWHFS